jgi:predicted alpha/beta superfamily hydrolase
MIALLVPIASGASAQTERPAFTQVTIPNTEVRALRSTVTGRDYDLCIYRPSKPSAPGVKYPVLYLLDGQWDFKLLTSIQGGLLYDKLESRVIEGERHSGNKPEAFNRGLRFLFQAR